MADPYLPPRRAFTRAHLIWVVGVFSYVAAVAARASFGVASVEASSRFGVDGAVLSLFGVVQLGTYGAAQIPAGLLLDRVGPRRMLVIGALTMAAGQGLLAVAPDVPTALVARLLTGVGDAATLISVLRLIAAWFPSRQVPVFTQLTTVIGQFGQVVAAVPFFGLLLSAGWTPAFASIAALLVVSVLLIVAVVRDAPRGEDGDSPPPVTRARAVLREVVTSRGTWAGFFAHWITLFTCNVFLFLWGVPYLTNGHGLTAPEISLLLTMNVVFMTLIGPSMGVLTGRYPHRRVQLVWLVAAGMTAVWTVTLLVPQPLTVWQLLPLMLALAFGSGTCSIGFDLARTGVRPVAMGTATGMVNVGGYSASLVAVLLIGVILDLRAPEGTPSLTDYRVALASQAVLLVAAAIGLFATTRGGRAVR